MYEMWNSSQWRGAGITASFSEIVLLFLLYLKRKKNAGFSQIFRYIHSEIRILLFFIFIFLHFLHYHYHFNGNSREKTYFTSGSHCISGGYRPQKMVKIIWKFFPESKYGIDPRSFPYNLWWQLVSVVCLASVSIQIFWKINLCDSD